MIHLLEIALVEEMDITVAMLQPTTRTLVDMLPVIDDCCGDFVDDYSEPIDHQYPNNSFVFLSQHWAVVHGKCTLRLISLCNKLAEAEDVFDDVEMGQNFQRRLTLLLRILKILGSLIKNIPTVEYNVSLVRAVASFADTLSHLFRVKFQFGNTYDIIEGSFESSMLTILPEFLHNVKAIFGDGSFVQNIQASIIASILGSLDSSVWIYDKPTTNLKLPLAYFPRFVRYTLELINDLNRQRQQFLFMRKDFDVELVSSSTVSQNGSPSCLLHLGSIDLLKQYTFDELLKLLFPESSRWINNLIQLALLLHSEGLKLRLTIQRSYSSFAEAARASKVENAVCHEDEDLFEDHFSETERSVGSADQCEQEPAVALVSSFNYQNLPIQAVTELLDFLETCIFSKEWSPLYDDACNKLSSEDIDILLSLMECQCCRSEENMNDNSTSSHEGRKFGGHIHELCSMILLKLLENEALDDSLDEYLVKKLLAHQKANLADSEDIMCGILSWLPVKDLTSFKCLSKLLNRFIASPYLYRAQLQNKGLVFSGFIHQDFAHEMCGHQGSMFISYITSGAMHHRNIFSFLPFHEKLLILASCQALVLCHGFSSQPSEKEAMYVCNITNRQYLKLPDSSCGTYTHDMYMHYMHVALVFDLALDPSEIRNKLKLIRVKQVRDTTSKQRFFTFDLYSPEEGEWRTPENTCSDSGYFDISLFKNKGLYIRGQLHWLLSQRNLLLTFDVDNEQSRITHLQRSYDAEFGASSCIGEFKGKLHYVQLTKHYLCMSYLDYADNSLKFSMERPLFSVEHTYYTCLGHWNRKELEWVEMDLLGFENGVLLMVVSTNVVLYDINKDSMVIVCSTDDLGPPGNLWCRSLTVLGHSGSLLPLTI